MINIISKLIKLTLNASSSQRNKYAIIPFGCYCMPRVITTLCNLKPKKENGEKTCPFDLAFFDDINSNTELLKTKFENFFENLEYDKKRKLWVNKNYQATFLHDGDLNFEEFKEKYSKRIENLYNYINNKNKHIFFVIATFTPIENKQIQDLINAIKQYRNETEFTIIIINQNTRKIVHNFKNVKIICLRKDKLFKKINEKSNGNWVKELKELKTFDSILFYLKIVLKLKQAIK